METKKQKPKKVKLYTLIDRYGETLIDAGTIQEIRDFFFENLDEGYYEDELYAYDYLIKDAYKKDKALIELVSCVWDADIELVRTITEKDLK